MVFEKMIAHITKYNLIKKSKWLVGKLDLILWNLKCNEKLLSQDEVQLIYKRKFKSSMNKFQRLRKIWCNLWAEAAEQPLNLPLGEIVRLNGVDIQMR